MADSDHDNVRAPAMPFEKQSSALEIYRYVDAPIVHAKRLDSAHVSVELLERRREGPVVWRYRQDRHALFLFERGIQGCAGFVDESTIHRSIRSESNLAFVAAGSPVDLIFDMSASCRYLAIFFDVAYVLSEGDGPSATLLPHSNVGFADPFVVNSLLEVRREVEEQDSFSRLMLEGLALQTWALLHRRAARTDSPSLGALGPHSLQKISAYMRARLAESVTVEELADLAGLSSRQFCRRFQASTGVSPGRALRDIRLDRAAELLVTTRDNVTEIALDCGFSQPQHLATSFRRRFGISPTRYRSTRSS